jgi:hypothetical protein
MTVTPIPTKALAELLATLEAAAPYARDAARRNERLGLGEEAAAAWAIYHRACWALRAAGPGVDGAGGIEHED